MKGTNKTTAAKTAILMVLYTLLMSFFLLEDSNILQAIGMNFRNLGIYQLF